MAFRDDREALRHEIRTLRSAVEAIEEEKKVVQSRIEELREEIERSARLKSGVHIGCVIPFLIVAAVVGVGLLAGDESSARTVFGRVIGVEGQTPIEAGDRCTAWLTSGGEDWDADVTVMCAGVIIYDEGYMDCEIADEYQKCADRTFSDEDDDPAIDVDRAEGSIVVWDDSPEWSVHIALGRPDLDG